MWFLQTLRRFLPPWGSVLLGRDMDVDVVSFAFVRSRVDEDVDVRMPPRVGEMV